MEVKRCSFLILLLAASFLQCAAALKTSRVVQLLASKNTDIVLEAGSKLRIDCGPMIDVDSDNSDPSQEENAQKVKWLKNGNVLVVKGNSVKMSKMSLRIRRVQYTDAGSYSCQSLAGGDWRNVTVKVVTNANRQPEALALQQESDDQEPRLEPPVKESFFLTPGQNFEVSCPPVGGHPTPRITWLKNGKLEKELQTAQDSWTLSIPVVTPEDQGRYTCEVTNRMGTVIQHFDLFVSDREPIYVKGQEMNAVLNSFVVFTCLTEGEKQVIWVKRSDDEEISAVTDAVWLNTHQVKSRGVNPDDSRILAIQQVTTNDNGWYDCLTIGPKEKGVVVESSTKLTVIGVSSPPIDTSEVEDLPGEDPEGQANSLDGSAGSFNETEELRAPTFRRPERMHQSIVKPAGHTVRMKCQGDGNPTPNITWYKEGVVPERALGGVQYNPTQWTMTLQDLVTADSGNYTCVLCNQLACINYTFKLDVIERFPHKPYIKEGFPRNMTVVAGDLAVLQCPTLSDLEPYIQWLKVNISSTNDDSSVPQGVIVQSNVQPSSPDSLELANVTYEDEGWYTCLAGNNIGWSQGMAYLRVVDSLEPDPIPMRSQHSQVLNMMLGVMFAVFLIAIIITIAMIRRLKREKMKKLLAIENARAAVVTQWIKKVIVEKQNLNQADASGSHHDVGLMMPVVKIEKQKSAFTARGTSADQMTISEYELPLDSEWEFPRNLLALGKVLGEGAFGKVMQADAQGILDSGLKTVVAVKMLKEGHTDTEMMDLVSEMEMMKMIGSHINIINLLGCCTQDGPLYVIVEFAPHGNMRDFLRQHRQSSGYEPAIGHSKEGNTLTQKDLVSFAYQVARGMEYLASRRCIHRDLAARNVLVGEDMVLKIADFGLARDVHQQDYYRKTTDGRLPVKWMAPEALFQRVYTTQSDVWSYGVLLWEIMTLGGTPYPSVPSVEKLFQLLRSGHRMEKPPCCSSEIYMMMRECWNYNKDERPTFGELVDELDRILTITANEEYLDLGLPQLDTPVSSPENSDASTQFPYLL
ncbi:fibroblast growth factor receptor homolog 1-like isoform X2 [Neocloeon triangulifer]|uniref:fibroblast growth factor receptor homolog 1-like isoform X2 n=1 Tax=Neocloeon triangulifer TaxID=2078957 RepID=UPI00286EDDE4|nr:fibroblast growth factor receptor homolog 1-like isoform X2 [Neocloeon triangulifer]